MPNENTREDLSVVYVGCGMSVVRGGGGVINLDNSPSVLIARHEILYKMLDFFHMLKPEQKAYIESAKKLGVVYGSATKLPFKNNSMDWVYSSHMVEHLYEEDFLKFLSESDRVLKPNGVFRMVIPDLSLYVKKYL